MGPGLKSLIVSNLYPMQLSQFSYMPPDTNERNFARQFDTFPAFLSQLPSLTEITFEECRYRNLGVFKDKERTFFTTMPFQLTKPLLLRSLSIIGCGMKDVDDANMGQGLVTGKLCWQGAFFGKLPMLETLDLSNNELTRLPETIGLCTSLTSLNITDNKIENLPDSLLMLTRLKRLRASENFLWKIPLDLPKYCPQLNDLHVLKQGAQGKQTLPLPGNIDKKIISMQRKAEKAASNFTGLQSRFILDYLASYVDRTSVTRPNRFKLVFVGDGAVGKTTTIRSLQQCASSNATNGAVESNILDNVATDGVDIKLLRVPVKVKKSKDRDEGVETLVFSCWDFAGQDIYTYSHSFFLTQQSIYLIGFDCSQGESSKSIERVDYWLQAIRPRFPDAHCIVFGTHTDSLDKEQLKLLQEAIYARYNISKDKDGKVVRLKRLGGASNTKDLFKVSNIHFLSNSSGKGVNDLLDDLKTVPALYEKMRVRTEVPLKWLRMEERGKAIGSIRLVPILSWVEWKEIAEKEFEFTEAELKDATTYLHETGSISWFKEEHLRDIVCLRPSFLTDVFAAVISAKFGINTTGFLQHEALPHIWKGLPEELFPHLLRILEKFEMIHRLDDDFMAPMAAGPHQQVASRTDAALKLRPVSTLYSSDNAATPSSSSPPPSVLSSPSSVSPLSSLTASMQTFTASSSSTSSTLQSEPTTPQSHSPNSPSTGALNSASNEVSSSPTTTVKAPGAVLSGYSVIPAMLPDKEPPAELLSVVWAPLPSDVVEYSRIYAFKFIPNGFFTRLLIRVLQSKWTPMIFWREGIVVKKGLAKIFLRYFPGKRSIHLRVRGPESIGPMGSLIDSLSTLIEDWLPHASVIVSIPLELAPGIVTSIDIRDLAKAARAGDFLFSIPNFPLLPPVRIDSIAPDVTMFTSSTKVFAQPEIKLDKEIGRGGFAVVYKGTTSSGRTVACKKLLASSQDDNIDDSAQMDAFTEFRREVWLMSSFKHPNIVSLLGVMTAPNLAMVLEFMDGGNLFEYLHGKEREGQPPASLSNEEKRELALGVAEGMRSMHSVTPPIIHRDLKTPNILIAYPPTSSSSSSKKSLPIPKIADFGLSRGLVWDPSMSAKAVDNPTWLAPEVINRKPYNEKVDVYAFGIILYEIVTGDLPFSNITFDSEKEKAIAAGDRPIIPNHVEPVLAKLTEQCWAQEPTDRPSFEQIVQALKTRTIISYPAPSRVNFGSGWEAFDLAKATPSGPIQSPTVDQVGGSQSWSSWRNSVTPI